MNVVFLTGMHRSGTSMVSRVVNLLGADLGPESALMPAKDDNLSGFWENRQIIGLNDDVLAALGGRWDAPPILEDGWEQYRDLHEHRARAREAIAGLTGREGAGDVLSLKDPRGSFLLPFWATVTPVSGSILTIRDPVEVAGSLLARDGIDAERAAYLWLRYVVASWRNDPKRLVVRYAQMFNDLDREIERLVDYLGLRSPSDAVRQQIDDFIRPELRHHADARQEAGPTMALASTIFELFGFDNAGWLDSLLEGLHESWLRAEDNSELRVMTDGLKRELVVAERHRLELIDERAIAVARGEELDTAIAELAAQRDALQAMNEGLVARSADDAARARELLHLEEMTTERDAAVERQQHLEARLLVHGETIDAAEGANRLLRQEVARQQAEITGLAAEREALDRAVRRWRIDRLERWLKRLRILR